LHEVAGVEEQAAGAIFTLVSDGGHELGETALAALGGREVGMQIVGVKDGERPDIGGRGDGDDSKKDKDYGAGPAPLTR
jgi:hypothetical protein